MISNKETLRIPENLAKFKKLTATGLATETCEKVVRQWKNLFKSLSHEFSESESRDFVQQLVVQLTVTQVTDEVAFSLLNRLASKAGDFRKEQCKAIFLDSAVSLLTRVGWRNQAIGCCLLGMAFAFTPKDWDAVSCPCNLSKSKLNPPLRSGSLTNISGQ